MQRFLKLILVNFLFIECLGFGSWFNFQNPTQQMDNVYSNTLPNTRVLLIPTTYSPPQKIYATKINPPQPTTNSLPPIPEKAFPPPNFSSANVELPEILMDDLDTSSLVKVIENYLVVLRNQDLDQTISLGPLIVTFGRLKATLEGFLDLLEQGLPPKEFSQKVKENHIIYQAGIGEKKEVLFTGYYTPVIPASRFKWGNYCYPIYQMPQSLKKTGFVYKQGLPENQHGAFHPGDDAPNFTREDIDGRQTLKDRNLEIAWLKNDLERYFLHIQGSGILKFIDGTKEGVKYAGSNGYSYKPIGREMLRDGVLPQTQGSMQGIKKYFAENPQDIQEYLFRNKRYVFFEFTQENPRGSSGAEVVAGRSIATDPAFYPLGTLSFMMAQKPALGVNDEITGWKDFSRFVVNQDTGSAIKGPERMDLYFGTGNRAGAAAGHYMKKGKVFFLIRK